MHYTDRAYTRALATLIARLDVEQVDWVGTSLGGHIGMMIAAEPNSPMRRLVLNDIGARVSAAALRRIGSYLVKRWRFHDARARSAPAQVHARFGSLTDEQWRSWRCQRRPGRGRRTALPLRPGIGGRFGVPFLFDVVLWQLWDASSDRC